MALSSLALIQLFAHASYPMAVILAGATNRSTLLFPMSIAISISILFGTLAGVTLSNTRLLALLSSLIFTVQAFAILLSRLGHGEVLTSGSIHREMGFYLHPVVLLTVVAVLLPFVAFEADKRENIRSNIFALAWLLGLACGLLTGYRFAALPLILPSVLVIRSHVKAKYLIATFAITAIVCFTWFARTEGTANSLSSSRSNLGRGALMSQAWVQFKTHPYTGVGIGSLRLTASGVDPDDPKFATQRDTGIYSDSKNIFLQTLAEMGLPGIVWLTITIVAFGYRNYQSGRDGLAINAAGLAMILVGLTECPFGLPTNLPGNLLFGFLIGRSLIQGLTIKVTN